MEGVTKGNKRGLRLMSLIGETKKEILKKISNESWHGYKLHKELGITTSTVYRHLSELEKAGMVEQINEDKEERRNKYKTTERGEKLLKLLENE